VFKDMTMFMPWSLVLVALVVIAGAIPHYFASCAPEGFEDEHGFHFVSAPARRDRPEALPPG
jgi:hypothetical protein